jgi:hypothetical protein
MWMAAGARSFSSSLTLAEMDLDGMRPREAMDALYRLKGPAKGLPSPAAWPRTGFAL